MLYLILFCLCLCLGNINAGESKRGENVWDNFIGRTEPRPVFSRGVMDRLASGIHIHSSSELIQGESADSGPIRTGRSEIKPIITRFDTDWPEFLLGKGLRPEEIKEDYKPRFKRIWDQSRRIENEAKNLNIYVANYADRKLNNELKKIIYNNIVKQFYTFIEGFHEGQEILEIYNRVSYPLKYFDDKEFIKKLSTEEKQFLLNLVAELNTKFKSPLVSLKDEVDESKVYATVVFKMQSYSALLSLFGTRHINDHAALVLEYCDKGVWKAMMVHYHNHPGCDLHLMSEVPETLKVEHAPAIVKLNDDIYKLIVRRGKNVECIPVPEEMQTDPLASFFQKNFTRGKVFMGWQEPIMKDIILKEGHTIYPGQNIPQDSSGINSTYTVGVKEKFNAYKDVLWSGSIPGCDLHLMSEVPETLKAEHAPAIVKLNDDIYKLIVRRGENVECIPVPKEMQIDSLASVFQKNFTQGKVFMGWQEPIIKDIILKGGHTIDEDKKDEKDEKDENEYCQTKVPYFRYATFGFSNAHGKLRRLAGERGLIMKFNELIAPDISDRCTDYLAKLIEFFADNGSPGRHWPQTPLKEDYIRYNLIPFSSDSLRKIIKKAAQNKENDITLYDKICEDKMFYELCSKDINKEYISGQYMTSDTEQEIFPSYPLTLLKQYRHGNLSAIWNGRDDGAIYTISSALPEEEELRTDHDDEEQKPEITESSGLIKGGKVEG